MISDSHDRYMDQVSTIPLLTRFKKKSCAGIVHCAGIVLKSCAGIQKDLPAQDLTHFSMLAGKQNFSITSSVIMTAGIRKLLEVT